MGVKIAKVFTSISRVYPMGPFISGVRPYSVIVIVEGPLIVSMTISPCTEKGIS